MSAHQKLFVSNKNEKFKSRLFVTLWTNRLFHFYEKEAFIVSGSPAISEIILWACKYSHYSPFFVFHWYLPLTLQRLDILYTATFLSVNMNIYSLFAFAPSASSLALFLSVKLPVFCRFSFLIFCFTFYIVWVLLTIFASLCKNKS